MTLVVFLTANVFFCSARSPHSHSQDNHDTANFLFLRVFDSFGYL